MIETNKPKKNESCCGDTVALFFVPRIGYPAVSHGILSGPQLRQAFQHTVTIKFSFFIGAAGATQSLFFRLLQKE